MGYFLEIQKFNDSYFSVDQLPCSKGSQLQTKFGTGFLGQTIPIACNSILKLLQPYSQRIEIYSESLSPEEQTNFRTILTRELSDKFPNVSLNLNTP